MRFFLGGYGADMGGDADGIGVLHAGAPDDALAGGELACCLLYTSPSPRDS